VRFPGSGAEVPRRFGLGLEQRTPGRGANDDETRRRVLVEEFGDAEEVTPNMPPDEP
jgi:hypothetical protein